MEIIEMTEISLYIYNTHGHNNHVHRPRPSRRKASSGPTSDEGHNARCEQRPPAGSPARGASSEAGDHQHQHGADQQRQVRAHQV